VAEGRIVLLATDGPSTRMVYHALRSSLPDSVGLAVILEERVPRKQLLRRRAERLGLGTVLGQVAFMAMVLPLLRLSSRARMRDIRQQHGLSDTPIPAPVQRVSSANSREAMDLLRSLQPMLVVVNGTRILTRETLAVCGCPFINMHAGITPAYRGVHGGYWALAEGRPDLVGTTVHRVDEGIDTGQIVDQAFFRVTGEDNFCTYPYLHTAAGLPLLIAAAASALAGELPSRASDESLPSVLRYHPTIFQYLRTRFRHGAR
jgi:folate-dependent phosphoribosylglycinamide formyltransferase PurN